MPVMDGFDGDRQDPGDQQFRDLPILAMTANATVEDKRRTAEAGMNAHISKPIEPRELFESLIEWIEPGEREVPDLAGDRDEEATREAADQALPKVAGLDVEAAVARLGGNVTSYTRLLQKFAANQADAISRLEATLDSGDTEEAVRIAHTLKGLGGTLGASELQSSAAGLEKALHETPTDLPAGLVESTARSLEQVLAAISPLLQSAVREASTEEGTLSGDELRVQLDRLLEMLGEFDTEAEDLVEQILGGGPEPQIGETLKEIKSRLGEYDFDGASEVLSAALATRSNEG